MADDVIGIMSNAPNLGGINLGYILSTTWFILQFVIGVALWGFVIYWLTLNLRYNILVVIKKRVGEGYVTLKDSASIRVDGKTKVEYFHLRKYRPLGNSNGRLKVPPADCFEVYRGVGMFDMFHKQAIVFTDDNGVVLPMKVRETKDLEPIDQDVKQWWIQDRKNIIEVYTNQSFLDKYGIWIAQAVNFILIFVLFLILIEELKGVTGGLNNAANAFNVAAETLRNSASAMIGPSP